MIKSRSFVYALLIGSCVLSGCATVAVGTATGVVASNPKDIPTVANDAWIRTQINTLLLTSSVKELVVDVHVEVSEGRVLLTGQTKDRQTAREAVSLAWSVEGVREVMNSIRLSEPKSVVNSASDMWIMTQVKSKLFFDQRIRSINYTVEVEDGVVYLLGTARDGSELQRATYAASKTSGVKRVVSYVRTQDSKPIAKIGQ